MIAAFVVSNTFDSILTVIDPLTKMAHFVACTETTGAKSLANLMLKHAWKLHHTPKTIVSDHVSVFIFEVTQDLNKHLGI